MGGAIHFYGKDAVVEAYTANNVPAWAIFSGTDIPFQYDGDNVEEGAGFLGECIDRLEIAGSTAPFQLRIYKALGSKAIDSKTAYNYSFRFRLQTPEEAVGSTTGMGQVNRTIMGRLEAMEARMNARDQEDDEEPEEPPYWQKAVGSLLENPQTQQAIIGQLMQLVSRIFSPSPAQQSGGAQQAEAAAGIAGLPPQQEAPPPMDNGALYQALPADERSLLDQALNVLMAKDPEVGTHLWKLSQILASDPTRYTWLASLLK